MTILELRKTILESPSLDWFNDIEVNINYPYIGFSQSLRGITTIYKFLEQQLNGWEKIGNNLPQQLQNSKQYFEDIKNRIENFVNSFFSQNDVQTLNAHWNSIESLLQDVSDWPFLYNCPETDFLIRLNKEQPNYFKGAYDVIIHNNSDISGNNIGSGNRNILLGAIIAYEFLAKDKTAITERRNLEKKSLSVIRNDAQQYLSESEIVLVEHLKNINIT
ncbi:MAG: hypothetical protein WCJ84_06060 [Candidatus Peregrinibacteria bacterium]